MMKSCDINFSLVRHKSLTFENHSLKLPEKLTFCVGMVVVSLLLAIKGIVETTYQNNNISLNRFWFRTYLSVFSDCQPKPFRAFLLGVSL